MADAAAHLVDRVLPEVPIRQWVLTLPRPLRYPCAWNANLASAILRCFVRSVFTDYRCRARDLVNIRKGQSGAVTVIQRFGSALNLTPHCHTHVLDGVISGPSFSPGDFAALAPPKSEDVARVLAGTARRRLRLLQRGGVESRAVIPPCCDRQGGMSRHADVAVPARDRKRLERLCRYGGRPPVALARLEAMSDGRLAYRLKTPWRDGTTHVAIERRELLERVTPLIRRPRAHQVRYRGVLAPCASGRDRVAPTGAAARETSPTSRQADIGSVRGEAERGEKGNPVVGDASRAMGAEGRESLARRMAWADSLNRVFEVDALRCPACGKGMRLIAAITDASVKHRILECLSLPPRAPPLGPAKRLIAEPTVAEVEDDPGFDFDQSEAHR